MAWVLRYGSGGSGWSLLVLPEHKYGGEGFFLLRYGIGRTTAIGCGYPDLVALGAGRVKRAALRVPRLT